MLSEQMKAEGWIEHDGGECPVDEGNVVEVRYRFDGWFDPDRAEHRMHYASDIDWTHGTGPNPTDIIAYRPETGHD